MDINMDFEVDMTYLLQCPNCPQVLQYYDYLSHIEICSDITTEYDGDNEDSDSDGDSNNDCDIDCDIDSGNIETSNENSIYNISSLLNLEFSGLNSYTITNNNMLDNVVDNMVYNMTNDLSTLDIGLGVYNLYLHSIKYPLNIKSDCVICMNTFEIGTEFYKMNCMHSFCITCTEKWFDLKSWCPLCKTIYK